MTGSDGFCRWPELEDELRSLRPEPDFEFLHFVEASLRLPEPRAGRRPQLRLRMAVAAGLTVALGLGLATTGGLSYAASSLTSAAKVVQRAATPRQTLSVRRLTSGGDQYRPGYGFGDDNHNHDGPPGLTREDAKQGALAPPLQAEATSDGFGSVVTSQINFDEQAHLYISVIDSSDVPLLLTQRSKRGGSKVGNAVSGPQTKFIQYAVLVPRTVPMTLRIPANLLQADSVYRLRVVAIDPDGNKSTLLIPFRA
jgi:hypothetical protein